MSTLRPISLHNTLTRSVDPVVPLVPGVISLYTCGPTVYNFAHIGNLKTYLFQDLLKRTFLAVPGILLSCMVTRSSNRPAMPEVVGHPSAR